ncbi:MAG TPA: hypothetical protein VLF71_05280 [Candidatus Saccharimonadales bacterium]|nr:hypothetical protein [Candidatus Saccharimonadales bacterium]
MFRAVLLSLLAAVPASTNYTLRTYDFGTGTNTGSSSSYVLRGATGGTNGVLASATYALPAGIKASTTAAVPPAPTLTDPFNAYSKLHAVLNTAGFPTDTKYLVAISSDNFATTNYVQLDDTVGATATVSNYQTYAAWGGASGFDILGLANSTTYKVKVAALQGSATGSGFGPTATASTQAPSVTLGLQTSLTATPPFSVAFSSLAAGSVVTGNATIISSVTTNAAGGGSLMVGDQNSGLLSTANGFTLASATADLGVAGSGYGTQASGATQSAGGPVSLASPFNGTSNSVGALSTTKQAFANWPAPVTSGGATLSLLAKSSTLTPAASDYADVITISLSPLF